MPFEGVFNVVFYGECRVSKFQRKQPKTCQNANEIAFGTDKPDRITVDMEGWTVDGLQNRTQPNKWTESRAIIAAVAMPGTDPTGL